VSLPGRVRFRLKSARAKVTRHGARYKVIGVAWGLGRRGHATRCLHRDMPVPGSK
jgi:hypothetical protein